MDTTLFAGRQILRSEETKRDSVTPLEQAGERDAGLEENEDGGGDDEVEPRFGRRQREGWRPEKGTTRSASGGFSNCSAAA